MTSCTMHKISQKRVLIAEKRRNYCYCTILSAKST